MTKKAVFNFLENHSYKLLVSIFILSLFINNIQAQPQNWVWAKASGGLSNDFPHDVATDSQGNVFLIGNFTSDSIFFGNTKLLNTSPLSSDIFVVKYNSNGDVIWAKSFGGAVSDNAHSVCIDTDNNAIITGLCLSNSIMFGLFTLMGGGGSPNVFTTKLDPNGNVLWAKSNAFSSNGIGYAVSVDSKNSIYVTGRFDSQSIIFAPFILQNQGGSDIFIVKYNSLGNVIWATSFGGAKNDVALGITSDLNSNILITGRFDSDSISIGTTTLYNSSGNDDIFVIKLDSNGFPVWSNAFGGNLWEEGSAITTDINSSIYITGYFGSSNLILGSTTLLNNMNGQAKIYLAKLSQAGNMEWAKTTSTATNDFSFDVCTDQHGDVYFTGRFWGNTLVFGSTTIVKTGIGTDIFLIKTDSEGNDLWGLLLPVGGTDLTKGNDLTLDDVGNIYASGYFTNANVNLPPFTINKIGASDIFIAKLNSTVGITIFSINENTKVSVYPNPFNFETTFYLSPHTLIENVNIELYNLTGQKVKVYNNIKTLPTSIERNNLSSGMYLYVVKNNKDFIASGIIVIQDE
ncbi:MAG: T9SS type A sorting domain-containing protein [Flavobacteriales bacterium]|nr:T9SS type A sorting domain-containing protein [Flavobacteriales bacterium]